MTDYNTYSVHVECLESKHSQYIKLLSKLNSVKNPTGEVIDKLVKEKLDLDFAVDCSTQHINNYYRQGFFANVVWFFSSKESEINEVNEIQKKAAAKINELISKNSNFSIKREEIKPEEKIQVDNINKKLESIDGYFKKEIIIKEVNDKILLANKIGVELVDLRAWNSPSLDSIALLTNKENELKKLETQILQLQNKKNQIKTTIIDDESLNHSMEALKKEVNGLLYPYDHTHNVPLPEQLKPDAALLSTLDAHDKKYYLKHFEESQAIFDRRMKTDPYFNFLIHAKEALDYRMKHKATGISSEFQKMETKTKELEIGYHREVDQLTKDLAGKDIIAGILKSSLTHSTWKLLSEKEKGEVLESLKKNFINPPAAQIHLERRLAHYKKLRDATNIEAVGKRNEVLA